jgi:hypothetical protein
MAAAGQLYSLFYIIIYIYILNYFSNKSQKLSSPVHLFMLTNSTEQSSFEKLIITDQIKRFPACCETRVHCRVHKSPSLEAIISLISPIHTLISYFFKIHFNIILPSVLRYSKLYFPFWFLKRISVFIFTSHMLSTCYSHIIFLDIISLILFVQEYKLWKFSLRSSLEAHATFFL